MVKPAFRLTCCSTADENEEFFKENDVDYVSFHVRIGDAEYADDLGKSISYDKFYKMISDGAMPVTSQVSTGEYCSFFRPILEKGMDILHITLSSGISGTVNSANIAADMMREEFPERKIVIVDSLCASSGYGMLVRCAAEKRDEGMSLESVGRWINEFKLKIHHWFFSTDLSHFKRGGRISAASAAFGSILKICPLMNMNSEGKLIPRYKIRTKKKAIRETVHMMELYAENGTDYDGPCEISESACLDDAEDLRSLVEEKFAKLRGKIKINSIGTVIGAHTGPGTTALFFVGSPRML